MLAGLGIHCLCFPALDLFFRTWYFAFTSSSESVSSERRLTRADFVEFINDAFAKRPRHSGECFIRAAVATKEKSGKKKSAKKKSARQATSGFTCSPEQKQAALRFVERTIEILQRFQVAAIWQNAFLASRRNLVASLPAIFSGFRPRPGA